MVRLQCPIKGAWEDHCWNYLRLVEDVQSLSYTLVQTGVGLYLGSDTAVNSVVVSK